MVSLILFWMVRMWCSLLRSPGVFPAIWMPPGAGRAVRYTPVADWRHTSIYCNGSKTHTDGGSTRWPKNLQPDPAACSRQHWSVCAGQTERSCSAASVCSLAGCVAHIPWKAASWKWLLHSLHLGLSSLDDTVYKKQTLKLAQLSLENVSKVIWL